MATEPATLAPPGVTGSPQPPPGMTTSTVYTTVVYTVTACDPSIPNCRLGQTVTDTIFVYTTVCPVQPTPPAEPAYIIGVLVTIIVDVTEEIRISNGVTGNLVPFAIDPFNANHDIETICHTETFTSDSTGLWNQATLGQRSCPT